VALRNKKPHRLLPVVVVVVVVVELALAFIITADTMLESKEHAAARILAGNPAARLKHSARNVPTFQIHGSIDI
jgi:hypothetical protein